MDGSDPSPHYAFPLAGETLVARASGALWWPRSGALAVSDLHLGKSERIARRGGALLPPYESAETVARLAAEVEATAPKLLICLGDSFDDVAAGEGLAPELAARLAALAAGRRLVWIAGNHDPAPSGLPGEHLAALRLDPLVFRHEASAAETGAEVSGHFHPKARLRARGRRLSRPCFLVSGQRVVMPAFGAYTGGLDARAGPLARLAPSGLALLTGRRVVAAPLEALG